MLSRMQNQTPSAESIPDRILPGSARAPRPSADSEITWLLHRAAQRMRGVTGEQAKEHGIQLRDYIVLSALDKTQNLTQVELGKALGLDRTTLMSELDRLERMGFVVRRADPRDRRARIPEITEAGNALRAKVASACDGVEAAAFISFSHDEVQTFRQMLSDIIGDSEDRGSCL
jgi:DNA-binding MarR family transcriptional regulator